MAGPSYYFTLFKKFQVLGHLPEGSDHGAPGGLFGYDVNDPASAFGSSSSGALLGTTPANSPLWSMLNAAATGASSVTIGSTTWPAMPLFVTQSWQDFQLNAGTKLVQVFSDWITQGKVNDIPGAVISAEVIWLSSNSAAATINESGLAVTMTDVGLGQTTVITAQSGTVRGTAELSVSNIPPP